MPKLGLDLVEGARQADEFQGATTYRQVTGSTQLKAGEHFVEVTTPAAATYPVILPPMTEAIGNLYFIRAVNTGGGEVLVVSAETDNAGTRIYTAPDNLSAAGDAVVVATDGVKWYLLFDLTT